MRAHHIPQWFFNSIGTNRHKALQRKRRPGLYMADGHWQKNDGIERSGGKSRSNSLFYR